MSECGKMWAPNMVSSWTVDLTNNIGSHCLLTDSRMEMLAWNVTDVRSRGVGGGGVQGRQVTTLVSVQLMSNQSDEGH